MKFLQEIIAKKKHSHQAYRSTEGTGPEVAEPGMSAQQMHAQAFGTPEAEAEPTPSIQAYEVPVENGEGHDSELDAFRDAASASLNGSERLAPETEPDPFDAAPDPFLADPSQPMAPDAMAWDAAEGKRHEDEPDLDDTLEYVDHFEGSADPLREPEPEAEAAPEPVAGIRASNEPDEADAAMISAALRETLNAPLPPEAEFETAPETAYEPEADPLADLHHDAQLQESAPLFSRQTAAEPAPEPEVPELEVEMRIDEAELQARHVAPADDASYDGDADDDTPPDASLFFDTPAEDRIMERTNQILAKSAPAEAAGVAAAAAAPKKIWDIGGQPGSETGVEPAETPQPRRRAGRVKTRLLGFTRPEDAAPDPFADGAKPPVATTHTMNPVGWIMVVKGPGRGACFTLTSGASKIGRGEGQPVRLDFGDTSISRDNHAAIAYDDEQRKFYLGHGGKANLVRLNDMPVLSTEPLNDGDHIRIGETTLRFIALCGPDFAWEDSDGADDTDAATF